MPTAERTSRASWDEAFTDLVCGETDWVRAEFDALVEASFGRPAGPVRHSPPVVGPLPTPARLADRPRPAEPATRHPGRTPEARTRAPPPPSGPRDTSGHRTEIDVGR